MQVATGETPVLLLDDVLSELDRQRATHLLSVAAQAEQVLLTTTDTQALTPEFLQTACLWEVIGGTLRPAPAAPA